MMCRETPQRCGVREFASLFADLRYFFFYGQTIKASERKRKEQSDAAFQRDKCVAESTLDLFGSSGCCCGIGNTPMRCHRLARPDGTNFIRSVIANGENEIHFGSVRSSKFGPTFA